MCVSSPEHSNVQSREGVCAALAAVWEAELGREGYFQDRGVSCRGNRTALRWVEVCALQGWARAGGWCMGGGAGAAGTEALKQRT